VQTETRFEGLIIAGLIGASVALFSCIFFLKEISLTLFGGLILILAILYALIAMRTSALKSEKAQFVEFGAIGFSVFIGIVLILFGLRNILPLIIENWPG